MLGQRQHSTTRALEMIQAVITLVLTGLTLTYAATPTPTPTCPSFPSSGAPSPTTNLIIDSDFLSFTDDAGAIAIANTLHTNKYVNLLGIVSDVTSDYALYGIDAINTWYCNPNISLAQTNQTTTEIREPIVNLTNPDYITRLANPEFFPQQLNRKATKDPVQFYTDTLSAAQNQSVTIVAIGFLTNLHDFYHSAQGLDLIKSKVKHLVVQGGSANITTKPHGVGYNLLYDLPSAHVLTEWPSPITFFPGFVAGQVSAGQAALTLPKSNPVRYVYETANLPFKFGPHDMLATYYAIFGSQDPQQLFKFGNTTTTGGLQFVADPHSVVAVKSDSVWNDTLRSGSAYPQSFLVLNKDNVTVAQSINDLLSCTSKCNPQ